MIFADIDAQVYAAIATAVITSMFVGLTSLATLWFAYRERAKQAEREEARILREEERDRVAKEREEARIERDRLAAQKVEEVKRQAAVAAHKVDKVAEKMEEVAVKTDSQLAAIVKTGEANHVLLNSGHEAQLKLGAELSRWKAERSKNDPDHAENLKAAELAERTYEEHRAKQNRIDARDARDAGEGK